LTDHELISVRITCRIFIDESWVDLDFYSDCIKHCDR